MIKELHLENFKAFGPLQKIPLKPITLIYGANSAGKSSVLHSVMFIKAFSMENYNLKNIKLTQGNLDLGGLNSLLHSGCIQEENKNIINIGFNSCGGNFSFSIDTENICFTEMNISSIYSIKIKKPKNSLYHEATGHLVDIKWKFLAEKQNSFSEHLLNFLNSNDIEVPVSFNSIFDIVLEESGYNKEFTKAINSSDLDHELKNRLFVEYINLYKLLNIELESTKALLKDVFKGPNYLGPFRDIPKRNSFFYSEENENTVPSYWDRYYYDFFGQIKVNEWLNKKKGLLPYKIHISHYMNIKHIANSLKPILSGDDILENKIIKYDPNNNDSSEQEQEDFDDMMFALSMYTEGAEKIGEGDPTGHNRSKLNIFTNSQIAMHKIEIYNTKINQYISLNDLGVGISQLLPIIINCIGIVNSDTYGDCLLVEEPEIHLHPALQSELGDLFIDAVTDTPNKQLLIETHSEHILLRIMRRIRETTNKTLPEGINGITPDDVAVLFVQPEKEGYSTVLNLRLDENGEFLDPWPGGFFEEGFNEMFS